MQREKERAVIVDHTSRLGKTERKSQNCRYCRVQTGPFYAVSCCVSGKQKYLVYNEMSLLTT